jgi:hypothetical protein
MISIKKVVNYKILWLLEIYNFYVGGFPYKIIWKTQKIRIKIISNCHYKLNFSGDSLRKPLL